MKKTVLLSALIIILLSIFFIPVAKQKSVPINATFYNVYQRLYNPVYWLLWKRDLKNLPAPDKGKIVTSKRVNGFDLVSDNINVNVVVNGYSFIVNDGKGIHKNEYSYTVLPQKREDQTLILVEEKSNIFSFLIDKFQTTETDSSHIYDLKYFMETPRLYYGFDIIKKHVTDTDILVIKKTILAKNKFIEAAKSYEMLKKYAAENGLTQTQPLMAQFLNKQNDSIEIKVGLPVNKRLKNKGEIQFVNMPATGYMFTAKFKGHFRDRIKVFSAVQSYFSDRRMPMPILPFEIYLDNKLPTSETDTVNIQLNCSTY